MQMSNRFGETRVRHHQRTCSKGEVNGPCSELVAERARQLWLAHGRPPEGAQCYLFQAFQEVNFNNQLLTALRPRLRST